MFADLDLLLTEIEERLLGAPMSDQTKNKVKQMALGGFSGAYYTELYTAYIKNPIQDNRNTLDNRLQNLFSTIFQLAEFQLF